MRDERREFTTTGSAVLDTAPTGDSLIELKVRRLGAYVGLVGIAQLLLYLTAAWLPEYRGVALYFDPRLGLRAFAELLGLPDWAVRWGSAFLLLGAAWQLIVKPGTRTVRNYAVLEIVLGGPSLLFIVMLLRAGLSSAFGFSPGELLAPIPLYALASAVPFVWAACLWWRAAVGS